MKQIEEIVKKAMGYSAERQDQVEVVNVPFGGEEVEEGPGAIATAALPTAAVWAPYVRYGVAAVLFVLILLFVVRPLMGTLTAPPSAPMLAADGQLALPQGMPPALPMTVGQLEASIGGVPRTQIVDMAEASESTALIVKQWLKSPVE